MERVKPLEMHTRAARRHLFVGHFLEKDINLWRAVTWGLIGQNPQIATEALERLKRMDTESHRAHLVEEGFAKLPQRRVHTILKAIRHSPLVKRLYALRMHERHGPVSLRDHARWNHIVYNTRYAVAIATEKVAMRYMNPLRARAVAVTFGENYGPFLQGLHMRKI
ncbi:hypothetical protein KJ765_03310 [Candidatus Micrarchaeota archaeon]|nr:hypothetical protein [Candidatus Micrarchaeota archaeon]